MNFYKLTQIFLIFLKIYLTFANSKFLKVEFCDSSNFSSIVERCDIVNEKFNLIYNVIRPYNQSQVRMPSLWDRLP